MTDVLVIVFSKKKSSLISLSYSLLKKAWFQPVDKRELVLYGICALPCTVVNASIFRYKSQLVILVQLVVIIICKVSIRSPYILCIFAFYW